MIDKIIVDGVDVSGCEKFTTEQPYLGITCLDILALKPKCEANPNCYYKQLKRKEEELQAEKEKVKELGEWKEANHPTGICETCTEISIQLADRYREALKEIRGIAGQINSTILGGEQSPKDKWVELYTITTIRILQKCEVLDV